MKKILVFILFIVAFCVSKAQTPQQFREGVIIGSFASDPTGYSEGQIYWNTASKKLRQYNGTIWEDLLGVVQNIEDLASTQIIDIGDIGLDSIEDGFNDFTFTEDIQNQDDGYVIINTIQDGNAEQYLFIGEGGSYGLTGLLVADADDFILVNESNELDIYVPYTGATKTVDLGLNNLYLGRNLFLAKDGGGATSQGLWLQTSSTTNGRYFIRLNANNVTNPGLNFLPEGNFRTAFWDNQDNEILRISQNSLTAPFANAANSTSAKSIIVKEVLDGYNELQGVEISSETYTLLEDDLQNYACYYLTYVGDQTITIPEITYSKILKVSFIKETTGTVTIIPSENVNQQQYVFDATDLAQTLYTRSDDVWNLWRGSATVSAYVPPAATNYVLNPTFDDASNLTTGTSWSIGGGVASYDDVTTNDELNLDLTTLTNGTTYDMTFEVTSGTLRLDFRAFDAGDSAQSIATYADYAVGTYTISWTATQDSDRMRIRGSSDGTAGDLDNVSITEQ